METNNDQQTTNDKMAVGRWFPCSADYFACLARALSRAREQVFIQGWWLDPSIVLSREGATLSSLLVQAAARGVDVYVLVYREVGTSFASMPPAGDQ